MLHRLLLFLTTHRYTAQTSRPVLRESALKMHFRSSQAHVLSITLASQHFGIFFGVFFLFFGEGERIDALLVAQSSS